MSYKCRTPTAGDPDESFLRAYFSRLGWTGEPDVSIDTLRQLHLQHNSAIPFENLDVLLPREIHLDDLALEAKPDRRPTRYCFEQNTACWSARYARNGF